MTMQTPKKYRFLIELGKALHIYGVPSYKIQFFLSEIAEKKGIHGSFMDLPTWVNYTFYDGEESYNYVECIPPGNLNLGALSKISQLSKDIINNEIEGPAVSEQLEKIHADTKKVHHFSNIMAYALSSAAFSLLIGTNYVSLIVAFFLGAFIYPFIYFSSKSSYIETTLEALISFMTTVVACLLYLVFPDLNVGLVVLSAIIMYIPGLGITTALEEITSRSLVSGSAKLFDSIISLFKQFFGAVLGFTIMAPLVNFHDLEHISNLPTWLMYLGIPLFSISMIPVFQIRKKDMFLATLTGVLVFSITVIFSGYGLLLSTFMGAVLAVFLSSAFSKITKSNPLVFSTIGIIMLVPGSKSFMGLSDTILHASIINNSNIFEQVAFILMGIIGGLLFAGNFKQTKIAPTVIQSDNLKK